MVFNQLTNVPDSIALTPEVTAMKRPLHSSTPALAAFVITVLLALLAGGMTLLPHQTTQVADSQVHTQIEQLVPAGFFD